jgi:hypothetical protein
MYNEIIMQLENPMAPNLPHNTTFPTQLINSPHK